MADELDPSAVGDGDDDQNHTQLRPVASSTSRCEERDQERHAGVPLRRVRASVVRVRSFSTNSRPALRAAASGGRPRAGNDTTGTEELA
jgi:hypothetical protein